jgi:hypothetical protein
MLSFDGINYFIDLEKIDEIIGADESLRAKILEDVEHNVFYDAQGTVINSNTTTRNYHKSKEIDGAKYETINTMLHIIMQEPEPLDDTLGSKRAFEGMPFNYKIAFNTLLYFGILVKQDAE